MPTIKLHKTVGVSVGRVQVGGGAPVVVQSMTMTDTADAAATAQQCIELAEAGSEMVRVTVNLPEAAAAVPEIKQRMLDAGCTAPLIGDFHYNGHLLLTRFPDCAAALDKYRINPGNVGTKRRRDEQFSTICKVAIDNGKPVRIGVNGGSLNQELVVAKMEENTTRNLGRTSEEILNECMVISAIESTALAIETGLRKDQIIISCKVSRPRDLIEIYRDLKLPLKPLFEGVPGTAPEPYKAAWIEWRMKYRPELADEQMKELALLQMARATSGGEMDAVLKQVRKGTTPEQIIARYEPASPSPSPASDRAAAASASPHRKRTQR